MNNSLTPLKAIRKKCLDCSCFQPKEVKLCPMTECTLYPYRFGHNPARKGLGARNAGIARKSISEPVKITKDEVLHG